jgi:hypothetical protein
MANNLTPELTVMIKNIKNDKEKQFKVAVQNKRKRSFVEAHSRMFGSFDQMDFDALDDLDDGNGELVDDFDGAFDDDWGDKS